MKELNLETAKELLHENMKNKNLRKHCYAVGKTLSAFYDYYKEKGLDTGGLDKQQWEIVGLLHDADWEKTTDNPERHVHELLEWLKEYTAPEELVNALSTHNYKYGKIRAPESLLEWTLECCDELTGFIVAVALVRPDKKLETVEVKSVLKKFKQKEFAKAVEREQITQCVEKLNIPVNEFIQITLNAMKKDHELLGL